MTIHTENVMTPENGHEIAAAFNAIMGELAYQDALPRRTDTSEAIDAPGFLTLLQVYVGKAQEDWAMQAGDEAALHGLRKIAAIAVRGMLYCGIHLRTDYDPKATDVIAADIRGDHDGTCAEFPNCPCGAEVDAAKAYAELDKAFADKPAAPQAHDLDGMTKHDISSESQRTYVYPDGFEFTIDNPVTVWIKRKPEGDSHRVLRVSGEVLYVVPGWRAISWFPMDGRTPVEF